MINNIFIFFNLLFTTVRHHLLCFNILFLELAAASRTRHLEKLKRAIREAKEANYDGILNLQIVTAERLRDKLARIEKLRHNILVMDQSTAAELRTYTHPPEGVRQSIMAVLVLLEYPKKDVKVFVHNLMYSLLSMIGCTFSSYK